MKNFLRKLHASLHCRFGTTAPFQILGEVYVKKIGFAHIPVIGVDIATKPEAMNALVPIARQLIFHELETMGITNESVEFVAGVQPEGRRRKFVDCNESSPTLGKSKFGELYRFRFEIKPEFVKLFSFDWAGNGKFPTSKKEGS